MALVGSATAQVAYTASKGAVLALTRELAMVHAREGEFPYRLYHRVALETDFHLLRRVPFQFSVPCPP